MEKKTLAELAEVIQASAEQLKKDAAIFEANDQLPLTVRYIQDELLIKLRDLYIDVTDEYFRNSEVYKKY